MPFINGKFYMNPAYGRALEGARSDPVPAEEQASQKRSEGNPSGAALPHEGPQNTTEARLAGIVYNETSGLRPTRNAKPGAPGSAEDLHEARVAIAEIARKDVESGRAGWVAKSQLTPKEATAIAEGNSAAVGAHNDSVAAARQALDGSDTTRGATQYRLRRPGRCANPNQPQAGGGTLRPI